MIYSKSRNQLAETINQEILGAQQPLKPNYPSTFCQGATAAMATKSKSTAKEKMEASVGVGAGAVL